VTPYDRELKLSLLGCPDVPAVSEEMAQAMAERVCVVLGADVGIAVTGVAGPAPLEGNDPGDVWIATHLDGVTETRFLKMPFDRDRIRQFTNIQSLNLLRNRLLDRAGPKGLFE
jgi:nicotinamide mononucleotide (NMN) deamidase PncC